MVLSRQKIANRQRCRSGCGFPPATISGAGALSLACQIEQPLNLGAALLLVFLEGVAQADAGLQQLQLWPQATALLSLLPTALKALLMLVAKALIAATAANAIIAAARAYSIRS
jgi:hypothetical protein